MKEEEKEEREGVNEGERREEGQKVLYAGS